MWPTRLRLAGAAHDEILQISHSRSPVRLPVGDKQFLTGAHALLCAYKDALPQLAAR
eukprot:CAMPEP_0181239860 /NCGR_PEP_ID=MMETSP1096-20121128/40192_1 /TAXON_ID=156174 ORGANISM="Chrysochromulina ericina, Strain CCMP281" /NCGR_SAMPLE_ID=MMETSP1096 /ASSEMBLY_ACC=CAM_ASM_000453 /LENGTH=56 /DNA_ID=CAMNT_0023335651 /DNA_START=216 /DNA_END=382 /DNA_ORIENTATION=-